MSSGTLILDVRRAQSEAARRALTSWQPPEDPDRRAAEVEALARGLLSLPQELRDVVRSVFANMPRDGTIIAYSNRRREELDALFDSSIRELGQALDLARECVGAGQKVPSLSALEDALRETEQARTDTLAHWIEFPAGEVVIRREDFVPDEMAFLDLESRLSPEARRELQSGLERLRRSRRPDVGPAG
jgi:hypothetical protein